MIAPYRCSADRVADRVDLSKRRPAVYTVGALCDTRRVSPSAGVARGDGRGRGRTDHAARVRCSAAAGLHPGARRPATRCGNGSFSTPTAPVPAGRTRGRRGSELLKEEGHMRLAGKVALIT